jgi:biotin transport system substrate-specific component
MIVSPTATLLDAVAARETLGSSRTVRVLSVLFFSVLTAAAAQVSVPLPFTQVPFTFQPMVVLVAGLTLGARLGMSSQLVYLAAGVAGLPVFAASATLPPGALRLLGPTGGYLMAYPFVALLVGYLAERGLGRRYLTSVLAMVAGLALLYLSGATWLAFFAQTAGAPAAVGVSAALATGVYPFVIADLIKLAAAAPIVPGLWNLVGRRS